MDRCHVQAVFAKKPSKAGLLRMGEGLVLERARQKEKCQGKLPSLVSALETAGLKVHVAGCTHATTAMICTVECRPFDSPIGCQKSSNRI